MPFDAFSNPDSAVIEGGLTVKKSPRTGDTGVSFDNGLILSDGAGNLIATSFIGLSSGGLVTSVLSYGALGNGIHDDTAAINSAITAVRNAGGGILFFPSGTYIVSSPITALGSNITFQGCGASSSIKLKNSANCLLINTATIYSNITFRDLDFDGNGANQTDGSTRDDRKMIIIQNVTALKFLNCSLHDGRTGAQVHTASCDYTLILGCRAYNVGHSAAFQTDAFLAFNQTHYRCIGNSVVGLTNPDTGFAQNGINHSVVTNNTIDSMTDGVSLSFSNSHTSHHNVIANNTINGTGSTYDSDGIKVSAFGNSGGGEGNIHDAIITGNVIHNCNKGMWIEQADRVDILGNIIADGAGTDTQLILLNTISGGTLNDLTIRGNTLYNLSRGIYFHANGTYGGNLIIEDNNFVTVSTPLNNVSNPSGSTNYWRRNVGWNPIGNFTGSGSKPATPGVPSTTVPLTNTSPYDVTVFITANAGGTTAVAIGGVATGFTIAASGIATFRVPAQQTITLTYTSAPTWTWFGD